MKLSRLRENFSNIFTKIFPSGESFIFHWVHYIIVNYVWCVIKVQGYKNIHMTLVCPYLINTGMFDGVKSRSVEIYTPYRKNTSSGYPKGIVISLEYPYDVFRIFLLCDTWQMLKKKSYAYIIRLYQNHTIIFNILFEWYVIKQLTKQVVADSQARIRRGRSCLRFINKWNAGSIA